MFVKYWKVALKHLKNEKINMVSNNMNIRDMQEN